MKSGREFQTVGPAIEKARRHTLALSRSVHVSEWNINAAN